jgi:radical SAM/Cys-rich protein
MPTLIKSLSARSSPLSSGKEQVRLLERANGFPPFDRKMDDAGLEPLAASGVSVLQINVGKLCNQTCRHCHVDAGPDRTEVMTSETARTCMSILERADIPAVDITGGAPELNPSFRYMVEEATRLGRHVMDRCNLSVLLLSSHSDLAGFLARHKVEVIASLPYYAPKQTDAQRGEGVFDKSIEAMRLLNSLGYGKEGSGLVLNLVANPVGAFLPPSGSWSSFWRRATTRRTCSIWWGRSTRPPPRG